MLALVLVLQVGVPPLNPHDLAVFAEQAFEEHGLGSSAAVQLVQEQAYALFAQRRYEDMLQLAEPAVKLLDARDPEHEEGRARLLEVTAIAKGKMLRYLEAAHDWRECAPILTRGPESTDQRNVGYNAADTMWRAGWYEEGRPWAELAWELAERQLPEDSGERDLVRDLRFSYLRFAGSWDEYLASLDEPILLEPGTVHEGDIPVNRRLYQGTPTLDHDYSFVSTFDPLPFRVAESGLYTIDMRSYGFDPYLVLRAADGRLIAEDDDSRGYTEARILVRLEASADYVLEPTALRWKAGPYRVELLAGEPPVLSEWEKRQDILSEAQATLRYAEEAAATGGPYRTAMSRAASLFRKIEHWKDLVRVRELDLQISLREFGEDSPDANMSRFRLAQALVVVHRRAEAFPYLESVFDFEVRRRGSPELLPWQLLDEMAEARWHRGEYELAEELYDMAQDRLVAEQGEDSLDLTAMLSRRGWNAFNIERFEEAARLGHELVARLDARGTPAPGSIARMQLVRGLYLEAEGTASLPDGVERSFELVERALGLAADPSSREPIPPGLLNLYAFLLCYTGDPAGGVAEWERMGPSSANQFANGADLYACLGDLEQALEHVTTAADLTLQGTGRDELNATLPEALRLRVVREQSDWIVGLLVGIGALVPGSEQAVYERLLALKEMASRSTIDSRERILADAPEEVRRLAGELRDVQAELARAFHREEQDDSLERLAERRIALEDELSVAGIHTDAKRTATLAELADVLPEDAVLVDFHSTSVYEPTNVAPGEAFTPTWWQTDRVSAWVLADRRIARADLGPADELEELARDLGGALVAGRGVQVEASRGVSDRHDELRRRLWDPIAPLVGDARQVFVSTTDFLGSVPLDVLQQDDGSFLIEHHAFVHLSDALQLLEAGEAPVEPEPSLLLVGAVDYDSRSDEDDGIDTTERAPLVASARPRSSVRGATMGGWRPLPFTNAEIERLGDMFSEGRIDAPLTRLTGGRATEEALKAALPRHAWVHIATHGFFRPEDTVDLDSARRVADLFPGLLSGLVLAGANSFAPDDREDGLLTAEELTWLDLTECELVTLSACETGLGSARGGAGLIGLRRALHQAGARTVVASLWTVEDQATAELMDSFYRYLWIEGRSRSDALRAAQLDMLERQRRQGEVRPSTWGAFVLSGEWR